MKLSPLLVIVLLSLLFGVSAPWWLGAYFLGVFTTAYYFGVFAMSWDLLFGFAGEVNFGPTFLIGLGAYGAGLLNTAGWPIPLCLAGGALAAVVGGVALALPALRLRGPYFGLITLVAVLLLIDCIVIFAGGMLTFYEGTASVDTVVDLSIAVQIIIAVVFGGRRTVLGGVLGAVFLVLFDELLRPIGQLNTFVVSGIALAVILFLPDGVLGVLLRPREGR